MVLGRLARATRPPPSGRGAVEPVQVAVDPLARLILAAWHQVPVDIEGEGDVGGLMVRLSTTVIDHSSNGEVGNVVERGAQRPAGVVGVGVSVDFIDSEAGDLLPGAVTITELAQFGKCLPIGRPVGDLLGADDVIQCRDEDGVLADFHNDSVLAQVLIAGRGPSDCRGECRAGRRCPRRRCATL
jgi:hypothetical protein